MRVTTTTVIIAALILATVSSAGASEVALRSASMTSLDVPPEHQSLGRVYFVKYPAHSAQVTFTSNAPLERIVGTSNAVVGYLVAEMKADRPSGRIVAGAFRVPVMSFDTGIPMRNDHVRGQYFLNAEEFPEIIVVITGSENLELKQSDEGSASYDVILIGELTIRGITREGRIPARITFLDESEQTNSVGAGDVLAMRCEYDVLRSDYNVAAKFNPPDLADKMEIAQFVMLSTVSAEQAMLDEGLPLGAVIGIQKFGVLFRDFEDEEAAYALADQFVEDYGDNAAALTAFAWDIGTSIELNAAGQALVMDALQRAVALTDGNDANVLSAVAFFYFEDGDAKQAVEWQQRAIDHKETSEHPEHLERRMQQYQAALASAQ